LKSRCAKAAMAWGKKENRGEKAAIEQIVGIRPVCGGEEYELKQQVHHGWKKKNRITGGTKEVGK